MTRCNIVGAVQHRRPRGTAHAVGRAVFFWMGPRDLFTMELMRRLAC